MSTDWLNQNSGGAGYPAVRFPTKGMTIVGEILAEPRVVITKNDKGEDVESLVVELAAREGTTADTKATGDIKPGDNVTLWIKRGFMASAIRDAVSAAGAKGLSEGDLLAVQFVEEVDTGKMQPAKKYAAKVTAAKAAVSLDSLV